MSVRVMQSVWQHSKQSGGALVLLLAIADNAHDDGDGAYPSIETLAKKARMTGRNVNLLLKQLQVDGEIAIKPGAGPHGCNVYRVLLPGLAEDMYPEKISGVKRFQGEEFDTAGVKFPVGGGEISGKKGVKPTSPKPLVKPSVEPSREPLAARAKPHPLPEQFSLTDERREWLAAHRPDLDPELAHEEFCTYWWSVRLEPRGKKTDWEMTWRNGMLRSRSLRPGGIPPARASPNGHGRVSAVDTMAALARQFREEEAHESRDVPGALDATFTVRAASR